MLKISNPQILKLSNPQTPPADLPWIKKAADAPYFVTATGENWMPIGQNDAISWVELEGLFRRKNVDKVEKYLSFLSQSGVTCLRLMLEYCHTEHRYMERPAGKFQPNMVRLWDDLFVLCAKYNLRILLTPFDTFWMWLRWHRHPYHINNGGMCKERTQWLLCSETREAIKRRLQFVTERWGGSGVLFAWDLWNEIHPAHAENSTANFSEVIYELSDFLRTLEVRLYGSSHLQTVSVFAPVMNDHPEIGEVIFRHPSLDFYSTHFYEAGTIDHPCDTVVPAIRAGAMVREALQHVNPLRPFFDSEHGPIHAFKDLRYTLPEAFDDEYFKNIQWAHVASGGAGGGMRWPNRHPHALTQGMRAAQKSLSGFTALIDWKTFQRKNLNYEVITLSKAFAVSACGDDMQAVVWLLRKDELQKDGMISREAAPVQVEISVPGLCAGSFNVLFWNTTKGEIISGTVIDHPGNSFLKIKTPPIGTDMAIAIRVIL